jgi:tRNA A-37 threonylcarbamoyl transferase component Bud32
MTDRLWLADPWRIHLHHRGLSTIDTFLSWTDGRRVSWRMNGLETLRITVPAADGSALVGYLKRYAGYRGRWSYFRHAGRLRREAVALQWLQERSLKVPPLLAWGIRSRWGIVTASFILTAEVEGAETLDALWYRAASTDRSRLLVRLATVIGRMHRTGFIHGNLYGRNILIATGTGEPYLIDFPASRMNPPWPIGTFGMVRDLSGLLSDLDPLLSEEATRFLAAYAEARWPDRPLDARERMVRRLARRISRRTAARRIRLALERKNSR